MHITDLLKYQTLLHFSYIPTNFLISKEEPREASCKSRYHKGNQG